TTDCDFKALIISQEEEYQNLSDSIKDTITSNGDSTEELNDLLKTYSEWMTKLKAMSDKNVSHLSEMCIQGYTMGMIKAIQKNHLYCDASKEAKHFGDKLISLHEKSIQDLKKYL
ncbi:MAG: RNA helicase, partial [Clostridiales bacterium Nov_37_41]